MLPYRLRPPTFATKEFRARKEQQEGSANDILSGGGPVQRAMEQDLMELRSTFLEQVENIIPATPQQHLSAGDTFKCFRHVFGQAKVALVHTRTVPPRSDRGAYVHLLYSACLSLLKQAFETSNDLALEHAAYAIFCLYALYETNPLPTEPATPLQLLPMGLQDPNNPKYLYRRTFKLPIRIDRYHYSLLQRLRDESLARQADCQRACMKAWASHVDNTNHTETTEEWTCLCGTSIDTVEIVDRIMPNLDLCEYTGPAGLEALAGHADYPYGCAKPKRKSDIPALKIPESAVDRLTDRELDALVSAERTTVGLHSLEEDLARYKSSLKEIHLPPVNATASNQALRIRDALKPVFERQTHPSTGDNRHGAEGQGELPNAQVVTTGVSESAVGPTLPNKEDGVVGGAVREGKTAQDGIKQLPIANALADLKLQLVFPTEIPESQREGIRTALNSAVAIGDLLIERKAETSYEKGTQSEAESISSSKSSSLADDDSAGQGAVALRDLLSAVSMPLDGQPVEASAAQGQGSRPSVGIFGSNFLTALSDLQTEDVYPESSSELSDVSAANVDIGGMSLQALWSAIDEGDGKETRRKRGRKKRKGRPSPARKGTRGKTKSRKLEPPRSEKRTEASQNISSESSEESEASIDVGRTSLQLLLSAVHEGNDEEPVQCEEVPSENKRRRVMSKGEVRTETSRSKEWNENGGNALSTTNVSDKGLDASQQALLSTAEGGNGEQFRRRRHEGGLSNEADSQHGLVGVDNRSHSSAEGHGTTGSFEVNEWSDSQKQPGSSDEDSISNVEQPGKAALSALLSLAAKDSGNAHD